ncbi:olfactory receptor 2D2-like isoform X2 [Rhinatrema bivittatum]|uniref:olfactory receptor 2D2-like isoform X2 n=1 Tax=Rhinatrema bivittatum TaxID=194408 RepID=UPI00112A9214|nr:olfactory receptor 2D2-like isoform X2 [Rhinatrema bivittatum]
MERRNQSSVTEFILLGLSDKPVTNILLFIIFLIIYMTALVGNIILITVCRLDSRLHTPMYFFLSNLSFLDICYTSSIVPKMLVIFLAKRKVISFRDCAAQMYIYLSLGETECILLAVMAYDRYVAICNPLRYMIIMNRTVCIMIATGTWIGGFLLSILHVAFTLTMPLCGHNIINHFLCEVPAVLSLSCIDTFINEIVIFVVGVLILLIPVFLILLTYIYIISTILKISSTDGRYKAFSTCASHLTVVTLFYGTAIFMYMRPKSSHSPDKDKMISVFYLIITPMLNPMIYSLRNQEVKGALRKVIGKNRMF